jgi:hypothetical protein
MNTLVLNVSEEHITGNWGPQPNPTFYFSCQDVEMIRFDSVMFRGGKIIEPHMDVVGIYRVAARCGRNQPVENLRDCGGLRVLLDSAYVNVSSIGSIVVEQPVSLMESSTTTILSENPYLDRFRGVGYHKADLHIAWMCPTCVPAVNKLIIEEPGVKSRSLAYGQKISYVIYDPSKVSLDRILMLTNAGGTATLLNDEEI